MRLRRSGRSRRSANIVVSPPRLYDYLFFLSFRSTIESTLSTTRIIRSLLPLSPRKLIGRVFNDARHNGRSCYTTHTRMHVCTSSSLLAAAYSIHARPAKNGATRDVGSPWGKKLYTWHSHIRLIFLQIFSPPTAARNMQRAAELLSIDTIRRGFATLGLTFVVQSRFARGKICAIETERENRYTY